MPRRKTQEEYVQQVNEVAPHISVIGEYNGNRIPIAHYCSKHGVTWDVSPFNFLQHPNGCNCCQKEVLESYYQSRRKTNEQFLQEVHNLGSGITPITEYVGYNNDMEFMCEKGHIWSSTPHEVLDGYGCPYCAGTRVLKGFNDLWTTDPDVASMLLDSNVGYEISRGSNKNVEWVCKDCGKHKIAPPKQIVTYGFACSWCSDGISYPNKFIASLLSQTDVQSFTPEWSPQWIGLLRYDAYFLYNNQQYVIEMDGGIGHGLLDFETGGVDTKGLQRDIIKENSAKENNVIIIRVDCNYRDVKNRFNYIKQSILNSELSNILDLKHIDWEACNKDATKSLSLEAAKQYNNGYSIKNIAKNLKISYDTVYNWLKRMDKEGLCVYRPKLGRPKKYS